MSNQPEALRLADRLQCNVSRGIHWDAAAELRRLHAEVSRLQARHQTAWQRGHAVGMNGLNEALRQMEAERDKFCAVLRQLHDSYSLASTDVPRSNP